MPIESGRPAADGSVSAWKGAVAIALVGVGLAALASSATLHAGIIRLLSAAESIIALHPRWGAALFIAASAVSAMLAFFSTAVIVPVAVLTWGVPTTVVMLWVGWLLGGVGAYSVARWLGRAAVLALTSGTALSTFERRLQTRAPFGLVLLFQVALPSEVPGYVLGLARYPFLKYLAVVGLGELPYAVGTVYLGESFLRRRGFVLVAVGVGAGLFSVWALRRLQKRLSS
jgi:uncharacterized membrane protein YdjX (TVP38/TMEM64 family)